MLAAFLLLLESAPPVPPPERDRHEAAIRLWQDHPPPQSLRQSSIEAALSHAAAVALADAGLRPHQRRWVAKHDALRERLRTHMPADRTALDRQALACAAQGIAYQLSVEDIEEARRFLSTPAGSRFWAAAAIGFETVQRCYQSIITLQATPDDFRAVGLRPPRPRFRTGEIVS